MDVIETKDLRHLVHVNIFTVTSNSGFFSYGTYGFLGLNISTAAAESGL